MNILESKGNISRINEIIRILAKYGFESIAQKISNTHLRHISLDNDVSNDEYDLNTRIRLVLQELGTTFIKLGQTLSTYPDMVGFELAEELSKLQESAPITSYDEIRTIIEDEFSKPIDSIFDNFEIKPIASASIGQVHKATLNNKVVAVKVQHPNIQDTISKDIQIMRFIANRLDNNVTMAKAYNLPGIIDVFESDIYKELDYKFEAVNAIHINDLLCEDEVHIPKIYLDYSTNKVLVMEFLDGVSLNKVLMDSTDKYDKEKIAQIGTDSFVKQILVHGFYHADPHPGNIFVLEENIVAFVDFGMMGHLSADLRADLAKLFIFISEGDSKLLTKQLYYMGIIKNKNNFENIENEITHLLDKYYNSQFNDVSGVFKELMHEDLLNKYGLVIPRDLLMVIRTIIMIDDIGKSLVPSFNVTEALKPYALKMLLNNFKPKRILQRTNENIMDVQNLAKKLPDSLLNFFDVVDDGKIRVNLEYDEIERVIQLLSKTMDKIVIALITAAILVGSSLIMLTDHGTSIMGYPIIGFVGFVFSAILGVVLIFMILSKNY